MKRLKDMRLSWPIQVVVWIFAFYIAWNLVSRGYSKLQLNENTIQFFASLTYPVWVLIMVGVVELAAPFLLFLPRVNFYGAVPIVVVMGFASYHSSWDSVPIIIGFLALIIAILTRPGLLRKKPMITKVSI